ncbi:cyclin-dependent kinase 1-B-like [Mytilus californianus]|uniref:cyclin-dependent kinase 1-B-like n=1 Tax=Mytilus californianus TaxID=6549 RepID=UPI0022462693|nr:cyclin-dependent kinase 1-B-like [Mytilus californianus]
MYHQQTPFVPLASHYQPFLRPVFPLQTQFVPRIHATDNVECLAGYTIVRLLGQGGFGKVYLAQDNITKRCYAIKCTTAKNQQSQSESIEETLVHEYNLLRRMSHPNIVTCYNLLHTGAKWYLVMEFMDMGSIKSAIERGGPMQEMYVKYITKQVLKGLVFLHSLGIVHRDIKG